MHDRLRTSFPRGSLLAALLGEGVPVDLRRAARRLRAEGAPALAVDEDVAELARGLAGSEVSRSPAVADALPPLFWIEAEREGQPGARRGWIVEKREGLSARGFGLAAGAAAVPETLEALTLRFDGGTGEEDEPTRLVRGLLAVVALPDMMAQMGEGSPVVLVPAEEEQGALRGMRLSVAMSVESLPQ